MLREVAHDVVVEPSLPPTMWGAFLPQIYQLCAVARLDMTASGEAAPSHFKVVELLSKEFKVVAAVHHP